MEKIDEWIGKKCSVLLVDWPSRDIPIVLIQSGFTVFSYSPAGYCLASLKANRSEIINSNNNSPDSSFNDGLSFLPLTKPPGKVDLVVLYRPPEEHFSIIRDQVLPLNAEILWLQPPVESMETQKMAIDHGLNFVQGRDIREIARADF